MNKKQNLVDYAYGPAPFWAWAGNLTPTKIDRDLKRFRDMEIYELVIMPLYGLKQRYMGPEYLRIYEHTCKRCRQYGQKIWIYDEFNWPSGTCAGQVLCEHPEARHKMIRFEWPDAGKRGKPTWKIEDYAGYDLAAYGSAWALNSTGYLDTLNSGAVKHYIRLTHEAYRAVIGDYFKDVILGFYTDEPVIMRGGRDSVPFTTDLFEIFHRRYGYDLESHIPELAIDTADAPRIRRDYWSLVTELFKMNFFRQYAGWCKKHGLKMTGHLTCEEILTGHVLGNGDMYDILSEMQVPGIDNLESVTSFDRRGCRARFCGEVSVDIASKLIESVGFFAGKKRLMCEAYGITPHSGTAQFYKRATDYLFHHGLSLINDNLFADSQASFRSGFGCHSFWTPWARHYKQLSRHIRVMSRLNSGSRLEAETAIYFPRTDLWRRFNPLNSMNDADMPDADWQMTQKTLMNLTHGLIRRHWNFYYIFEQVLERAEFNKKGLIIKDFNCRVIVMPDVHAVPATVAAVLRRFIVNGGYLLCVLRKPQVFDEAGRLVDAPWLNSKHVVTIQGGLNDLSDQVARILERHVPRKLKISGEHTDQVMLTHRHARGREYVFMTNFGEQTADVQTNLDGKWQPADKHMPGQHPPVAGRLLLQPNTSVLLKRGRSSSARRKSAAIVGDTIRLASNWKFRLPEGNTAGLPVQIHDRRIGSALAKRLPFCKANAPFDLAPGQSYWLRAAFKTDENIKGLQLVTDGHDKCEIFIGQHRIRGYAGRQLWDDSNLTFDLPPCLAGTEYSIHIRYTPNMDRKYITRFWPLTNLPPFVLAGQFTLDPKKYREGKIVLHIPPQTMPVGNLLNMGLPNIAGVVEYATTIKLIKKPRNAMLDLGAQNDTFEVRVNGQDAGILMWPPYRLDIGKYLRSGTNRIVLRLQTAMGGILLHNYRARTADNPPTGLLEVPIMSKVS